jgi:hypothetical protein
MDEDLIKSNEEMVTPFENDKKIYSSSTPGIK